MTSRHPFGRHGPATARSACLRNRAEVTGAQVNHLYTAAGRSRIEIGGPYGVSRTVITTLPREYHIKLRQGKRQSTKV